MDGVASGAGAGAGAGGGASQHASNAGAAGASGVGGSSGDSGPVRIRPQGFRPYSKQDHNAGMHERNIYKTKKPDFAALAVKYPRFTKYVMLDGDGVGHINFKDPYATLALTQVLLKDDFGLDWDMPIDRLCPTLTVRLNYIHWVEDLLAMARTPAGTTADGASRVVKGIDIGTGASCIYALLGATMNKWQFVATEVAAASVTAARANVERNNLQPLVEVRQVTPGTFLVPNLKPSDGQFDFCMCNPPFFANLVDAVGNPANASMGQCEELVFPGGELAFVQGIIADSKALGRRVRWYTSMLGKKASLKDVLKSVAAAGATASRTTQFLQGKTVRWAIAWTFCPLTEFQAGVDAQANKAFSSARPAKHGSKVFQAKGIQTGEAKKRIVEALVALHTVTLSDGADLASCGTTWDELEGTYTEVPRNKGNAAPGQSTAPPLEVGFHIDTKQFESGCEVTVSQVADAAAGATGGPIRATFERFADVVQRDTERTSRKWRRMMKRQEEGGDRPGKKQRRAY